VKMHATNIDAGLRGCYAMWTCRQTKNVLKEHTTWSPEDGGNMFLWNVGIYLQSTQHNNPEDQYQQLHHRKNLKSNACHIVWADAIIIHAVHTGLLAAHLFWAMLACCTGLC
jgi:hypothetical protein